MPVALSGAAIVERLEDASEKVVVEAPAKEGAVVDERPKEAIRECDMAVLGIDAGVSQTLE